MLQSSEELLNTTDLMRTNKRQSNKISAPSGPMKKNIKSNKNQTYKNNNNRKPQQ